MDELPFKVVRTNSHDFPAQGTCLWTVRPREGCFQGM